MRLYFGRVAPVEPQQEQLNGGGWSWRYKVRIFDKHTEDTIELPDKDLPWAQVLLPVTAGSGAANYATSPQINQGDTVSIAYYDEDEQMPIITGLLPRSEKVSVAEPAGEGGETGYIPHTGYSARRTQVDSIPVDETNQSSEKSQPSPQMAKFSSVIGDTTVTANTCDPNEYKTIAINAEINNLFNQLESVLDDASKVESLINGAVDRIHALVNPYVAQFFSGIFNALIPILNSGLSSLYQAVYASVLASTSGNEVAARLAAEAVLKALQPPIMILQEAISLIANEIVSSLLGKVNDLVRDAVDNNDRFTTCAGTQFNAALVNSIIGEIDDKISPLLNAVSKVLSGGFNVVNSLRSSVDIVKDLAGGLLSSSQSANKCRGRVKEYAFGVGPLDTAGDIIQDVIEAANTAAGLVSSGSQLVADISELGEDAQEFLDTFGDFPFTSIETGSNSDLDRCSTDEPEACFGPEVFIFGGRGYGAKARAIIGDYVASNDDRTVSDVQGGVVSIEVLDGGLEYSYPPFVELRDNCGLGLGAVARAVVRNGRVVRIYIVKPGEGYVSDEGEVLLGVGSVEVIAGGSGYTPGIVIDQYGGEYEIVVNEGGIVRDIIPINIIQVPDIPVISIPNYDRPLPPGSIVIPDPNPPLSSDRDDRLVIIDSNGRNLGRVERSRGLNYKVNLVVLPTAEQVLLGEIPDEIAQRIPQDQVQQIIDCIQS